MTKIFTIGSILFVWRYTVKIWYTIWYTKATKEHERLRTSMKQKYSQLNTLQTLAKSGKHPLWTLRLQRPLVRAQSDAPKVLKSQ